MIRRLGLAVFICLLFSLHASAQTVIYYKQASGLNPVPVSVATPLPVTGAGTGGASQVDQTVFTQGTSAVNPIGCFYAGSYSNIPSGDIGVLSCTNAGALNVNVVNANANGAAAPAASSPVTPSNQPVGAANFAATQVSVASSATSIVAARTGISGTGRISVTITNTTTTAIYLGGSGVTTSTGTLLPGIVGASVTLNTTAAVYGIVASSTATVTEFETY